MCATVDAVNEPQTPSKPPANSAVFNVADFGAVGDGVHDDTDAVLAAVKAAGSHGIVEFGRGRFRLTRTITVPADQAWRGVGIADTGLGTREPAHCVLTDVSDGPAIIASYNTSFDRLHFRGADAGTCFQMAGRVRLNEVNIQHYGTAIRARELWYGHFSGLRLYRNEVGIDIDHSYNLTIVEPRFLCVRPDDRPGIGLRAGNDVDVKIFGGSIEGYQVGLQAAGSKNSLHVWSTYFESSPPRPEFGDAGGATAIQMSGSTASTLSVSGCYVYLHHTRFFVDVSGERTGVSVQASNNLFQGGNPLGQGASHQAYRWTNGSDVRLTITGERWEVDFPENSWFMEPDAELNEDSLVLVPAGSMQRRRRDGVLLTSLEVSMQGSAALVLGTSDGVPALRSDERATQTGMVVFHRPSRRPIVWDGQAWTFFDGTSVPLSAGDRVEAMAALAGEVPLGPLPLAWTRARRFLGRQARAARQRLGR